MLMRVPGVVMGRSVGLVCGGPRAVVVVWLMRGGVLVGGGIRLMCGGAGAVVVVGRLRGGEVGAV